MSGLYEAVLRALDEREQARKERAAAERRATAAQRLSAEWDVIPARVPGPSLDPVVFGPYPKGDS